MLPDIVWDYDQLSSTPSGDLLASTLHELAKSVLISNQYSALRFCRDVTGWVNRPYGQRSEIELGVVSHDEVWERLTEASREGAAWKFFKGFSFPVFTESKRDLWNSLSPVDREILKLTFCCESPTEVGVSCVDLGMKQGNRCGPCRRRFEGLL